MTPPPEVPFPAEVRRASHPRITPGRRSDIGPLNTVIVAALGRAAKTGPLNIFTTLGRHRRLFRGWLRFAGRLMPFGKLPRRDTELVILRTAANCGNDYEWSHHVVLGQQDAGLTPEEIERVGQGPDAPGWSAADRTLLRAVDELCRDDVICADTWNALAAGRSEPDLIELCLLAGHYRMIAGTLNSLGVRPER